MSISDELVIRPNVGNKPRRRGKKPRLWFLETEVTEDERDQILIYCLENKISVSQFLAEVIFDDAAKAETRKHLSRKMQLEFSEEDYRKLELLVHVQGKRSVAEFIYELVQPYLGLQRLHRESETRKLRFYLSDREHGTVKDYLESRGATARRYVSFLAIQKIAQSKKRRKK